MLLLIVSGCSVYDFTAISADIALNLFTDVNEDREPDDESYISFWDPATSKCIKVEKDRREISRQVDAMLEGKDFVILPTGEKYPLEANSVNNESLPGPTSTCIAKHSD